MEYPELADIERRAVRYWNVDGLPEIVMGALWVLWAVAFLLPEYRIRGGWRETYWAVVPFLLVGSGFASVWLTKKLKAKWTFPRAGYVEWKEPSRAHHLLTALIAGAVAAGLTGLIVVGRGEGFADLAAPGFGALLAGAFLIASKRQRLPHFLWLSAASLLLGFVLYPLHLGWNGMSWLMLAIGAATALAGSLRFRSFLRSVPQAPVGDLQ